MNISADRTVNPLSGLMKHWRAMLSARCWPISAALQPCIFQWFAPVLVTQAALLNVQLMDTACVTNLSFHVILVRSPQWNHARCDRVFCNRWRAGLSRTCACKVFQWRKGNSPELEGIAGPAHHRAMSDCLSATRPPFVPSRHKHYTASLRWMKVDWFRSYVVCQHTVLGTMEGDFFIILARI